MDEDRASRWINFQNVSKFFVTVARSKWLVELTSRLLKDGVRPVLFDKMVEGTRGQNTIAVLNNTIYLMTAMTYQEPLVVLSSYKLSKEQRVILRRIGFVLVPDDICPITKGVVDFSLIAKLTTMRLKWYKKGTYTLADFKIASRLESNSAQEVRNAAIQGFKDSGCRRYIDLGAEFRSVLHCYSARCHSYHVGLPPASEVVKRSHLLDKPSVVGELIYTPDDAKIFTHKFDVKRGLLRNNLIMAWLERCFEREGRMTGPDNDYEFAGVAGWSCYLDFFNEIHKGRDCVCCSKSGRNQYWCGPLTFWTCVKSYDKELNFFGCSIFEKGDHVEKGYAVELPRELVYSAVIRGNAWGFISATEPNDMLVGIHSLSNVMNDPLYQYPKLTTRKFIVTTPVYQALRSDHGIKDKRMMLILAPSGSGKSYYAKQSLWVDGDTLLKWPDDTSWWEKWSAKDQKDLGIKHLLALLDVIKDRKIHVAFNPNPEAFEDLAKVFNDAGVLVVKWLPEVDQLKANLVKRGGSSQPISFNENAYRWYENLKRYKLTNAEEARAIALRGTKYVWEYTFGNRVYLDNVLSNSDVLNFDKTVHMYTSHDFCARIFSGDERNFDLSGGLMNSWCVLTNMMDAKKNLFETVFSTQTHKNKAVSFLWRYNLKLGKDDMYNIRDLAIKLIFREFKLYKGGGVNAVVATKSGDVHIAVAGHMLNLMLYSHVGAFDVKLYARTIWCNLACHYGSVSKNVIDSVREYLFENYDPTQLWHNYYDYVVALAAYLLIRLLSAKSINIKLVNYLKKELNAMARQYPRFLTDESFLFNGISKLRIDKFKFNKEAVAMAKSFGLDYSRLETVPSSAYSSLSPLDMRSTATFLSQTFHKRRINVLMDGTANIGCDLLFMLNHLDVVEAIAVESDYQTYKALQLNVSRLSRVKTTVINGKVEEVFGRFKVSLLYLDPPWGGPDYRNNEPGADMSIHLRDLLARARDRSVDVVLKLPLNYDVSIFDEYKQAYDITNFIVMSNEKPRYYLVSFLLRT